MTNKILHLLSPKVKDFRKEIINEYDTVYEVTFSAEPMIRSDNDIVECGPVQTFYLIYNSYLSGTEMVISDLSFMDATKEYGEGYWEDHTNNIVLSDKKMFVILEILLFGLDKESGAISMFIEKSKYINVLHDGYIYGPMVDEDVTYLEYLYNLLVEKSEFAKEI